MFPSVRVLQTVVSPSVSCLISQAQRLSCQNLLIPLRQTIDTFLSTPNLTSHDFNRFLRALACLPYRSAEGMRSVERVIGGIQNSAGLGQVEKRTWVRLVRASGLGTGKGEGALRLVRQIHNYLEEPDEGMLRALLSVYAKHGALADAKKCFDSLVALRGGSYVDPHWTTTLLTAFDNKDEAREFLESLPSTTTSSPSSVHAHTTALHIAAKDLRTSTYNLIRSFLLIQNSQLPSTPTYTVLIRGLILRKEYHKACIFFHKLTKSGLSLDNAALGAGLEALTRNGQPHVAFQVLEKYATTTTNTSTALDDKANHRHQQITLTTLTINTFLVSLNRIGRPDISIRLFTHLQTLYGCLPNSQTLSIILQAARLAVKLDASPSTPRLRALLPFGKQGTKGKVQVKESKRKPKSTSNNSNISKRKETVDFILSALGHPSRGGLRRYVNGSYMGLDPAIFAKRVFEGVLGGVLVREEEEEDGRGVNASADGGEVDGRRSLGFKEGQHDEDTKHVSDIGLTISHFLKLRRKLLIPSDQPETELGDDGRYISDIGLTIAHVRRIGRAWKRQRQRVDGSRNVERERRQAAYPSIIPTNSNFFNYLFLLCCLPGPGHPSTSTCSNPAPVPSGSDSKYPPLTPTPHLIPYTLSLMRRIGIQPSNSTLAVGLVGWWDVCQNEQHDEIDDDDVESEPNAAAQPPSPPPPRAYVHFVDWLRGWVGETRLPHWRTLEKWRGVLERARVARGDCDRDLDER